MKANGKNAEQINSADAKSRAADFSGNNTIKCWSAGSASGEEAYTIALVWQFVLSLDYPGRELGTSINK